MRDWKEQLGIKYDLLYGPDGIRNKGRPRNGIHDGKRDEVEMLLGAGFPITRISKRLNIPLGSMAHLLARWGLLDKQIRQLSEIGRKSISEKLKKRHKDGYMQGKNHWSYGKLKLHCKFVPAEEVKMFLEELLEQDPTIADMAKECGVDPKTITNWLSKFGLQRGARSGDRAPNWKGGHSKYRGPGWLTIREQILERDGYKCVVCGKTREEARAEGHGLSVHHIVPFCETQDNSYENLETLCQSHHMIAEWELENRRG